MKKMNANILRLAREARFLTQEELAGLLGVEQGTLSKIEKEILLADDTIAKKIAEVLDYPLDFFYQDKKVIPVEGHYRRKISTPVKKMKQYIAQMTIAEWHFTAMIDEIELHLHPPLQQVLLRALLKLGKNNQFIITTHSDYIEQLVPEAHIVRVEV